MQNVIAQTHGIKGQPEPVVGMGATMHFFSDREAFTVVKVVGPKTIIIQEDSSKRVDDNGMSEVQDYEYSRNPDGGCWIVTLRKNGWWIPKGYKMRDSPRVLLDHREKYHDYTF